MGGTETFVSGCWEVTVEGLVAAAAAMGGGGCWVSIKETQTVKSSKFLLQ